MAVAALPDELRARLPSLIDAMRAEQEPATDEELVAALTQTLSLGLGQGMSPSEKAEFYAAATIELRDLPRDWALAGLKQARRRCQFAREIVKFVIEYAEDYPERARARLERLEQLARAAGVQRDPGMVLLEARR